jgi:hypothetical protein
MPERRWYRSLAGVGLMLALSVLALCMVILAHPAPGMAAKAADEPLGSSLTADPSRAVTSTVFLPFVEHTTVVVPNLWHGQYYDNMTLAGEPVYTTDDEVRVDYDWGTGAPTGLPAEEFSVRWTGDWGFEAGHYTFFVFVDGGVRLWLDGELLIDRWVPDRAYRQATALVNSAGLHSLKLEYLQESGLAAIQLQWRRTDLYPQWDADLYNQPWVETGWVASHTERVIQYDWGEDCPAAVQPHCDGFSIAWEAEPLFEPGSHRIHVYADDGYQLFVDGDKVMEGGWDDGKEGGREDAYYDFDATGVEYRGIAFNFHDRGSLAEARLWIEYLEHPYWTAEYFGNKDLGGPPVTVKQEAAIFYDWGFGKPYAILPYSDHFSVRWTGQRYFHAGWYRFGLFSDDGVRLWVDGQLLVDEWHENRAEYHSQLVYLGTGYHDVVVEYYENEGEAEIRLWWE